ncbi:hypothetical protein DYB32_005740 [Aphanomyces invadans]|uniref:Protein kinase domain-containing protein n=1 Tax=Aphanomyces invadans TaxID=157072 RepID=A0A418ATN6_9STRA|nr:hypothetical protein DYB32_005740 [Aphanomyces invadans]
MASFNCFFNTFRSGSMGLNITEACQVFLLGTTMRLYILFLMERVDPWWNTAIENQAIDRVFRLGQTSPVHVFKFIVQHTIEERVVAIQLEKTSWIQQAFQGIKGASDSAVQEKRLDVASLFQLDIDQVVVKLTTSTTEINFFRQVNRSRTAGQAVHHIVEWRAGGDVDFLGVGSCKALVLQRGACTMKEKFAQNRLYATDKNNCVFHVVKALEYVHTLRYIHGNLTLENVMMFSRGEIKLIDFANTVALNADMPLHCTPEYCPPEMAKCIVNGLRPLKASPSYDVWCLGVFILKLFSPNLQLQEFVNLSDEDVVCKIAAPGFSFHASVRACSLSSPQKNMLLSVLDPNPATRSSLRDVDKFLPRNSTASFGQGAAEQVRQGIADLGRKVDALHVTVVEGDRFTLPCLWTLEERTGMGFVARSVRALLKTEFRVSFICEMRDGDRRCEPYPCDQEEALIVTANSPLVQGALPFLKVTCSLFKVLGLVAGAGGIVGDFFKFDDSTMANVTSAIDAVANFNENVIEKLDVEEKLNNLADSLADNRDPEEVASIMSQTLQIYKQHRKDAGSYERLHQVLGSIKFDWTKHHIIGGLVKKVIKSGFPDAGEVRWVCKAHAESNENILM